MNKIYVVEGMDRCGKSTIIQELRKNLTNFRTLTLHSNKPPVCVDAQQWSIKHYNSLVNVVRSLWCEGYDIVLDRSWIGEAVYGPLYRNTDPEDRWIYELEEYVLFSRPGEGWYKHTHIFKNPVPRVELIVCVDSPENMLARDDGLGISSKPEDVAKERELFITAFNKTNIKNKTLIDWNEREFNKEEINKIVSQMISNGENNDY